MPTKGSTMKKFDALQAKQIVESVQSYELRNILADIKAKAYKGETVLFVHHPIKGETLDALRSKGFTVKDQPSIAIQKDSLYYSVSWK